VLTVFGQNYRKDHRFGFLNRILSRTLHQQLRVVDHHLRYLLSRFLIQNCYFMIQIQNFHQFYSPPTMLNLTVQESFQGRDELYFHFKFYSLEAFLRLFPINLNWD
jgi:hypothetical protein